MRKGLKQGNEDARPQRPYVRDVGRQIEGPADAITLGGGFILLALVTGFVIGIVVFFLMNLSIWLTGLVWDKAAGALDVVWFPLVVCPVGGLAIGLWTHFSGNRISSLEEVLREFKQTGRYSLNGPVKAVVSFLLPLVFGGSVGFEAGLTGIVTAGCCWIRDKLKAAGLRAGQVVDVSIAASLSAIFGAPLAGIVAGAENSPRGTDEADVDAYDLRRGVKLVLYMAAAVGAFAGIVLLSSFMDAASGLPRFDAIERGGLHLLWVLPCLAAAYVMGFVYHCANFCFARLAKRMGDGAAGTILKPLVAGVVLGALALAFPLVCFPGEEQCTELMATWTTWTAVALIATGVLKAVATPMCIRMGWMGGVFFPSIFAGVACGYGLAALTGADPMLMVTVTATAYLAAVTRKPLLSAAILILCFPLTGILWSGLAAVVGGALPLPKRLIEVEE